MSKKKGTMTVRIPGTGRQLAVPKGLTGDALARHVEGVLQAEATAAAQAEAAAKEAAFEAERQQLEELSLQQQRNAANRPNAAMEEELQALKRAHQRPPTCCWRFNKHRTRRHKPWLPSTGSTAARVSRCYCGRGTPEGQCLSRRRKGSPPAGCAPLHEQCCHRPGLTGTTPPFAG